jgi:uncharacterized damage-inducible protein DinB
MKLSEIFLSEFDHEMANTRKTLERVPDDKLGWKPHEKSGTMGWLAGHVANLPSWASVAIGQSEFDLAPQGAPPPQGPTPNSRKELLDSFDKNVAAARAAIASASDELLMKPWTLLRGGQQIFSMPRSAVLRSFVLNHLIHHRAQLGVYLRLNDVPVPAIYGPSADEGAFGQAASGAR